ncbi:MAG: S-layer homology domain-containing protein [Candidatus Neomarinimicrobiota bacterium]
MKKVIPTTIILFLLTTFYNCGPKIQPQSEVDTPEYHYRAGLRYMEEESYGDAIDAFQRSVGLDKKFAPGWAGLGLATGLNGDLKLGRDYMDKALGRGKKDPNVHVLAGRLWIEHRNVDKKWMKRAKNEFERALKLDRQHEAATYYLGYAYLQNFEFPLAENEFRKLVERKGEYATQADEMWALSQKIVRAQPGTLAGKRIALHPKITRADLTVLFIEELKLPEIFERFLPQDTPTFQTPGQMATQVNAPLPADVQGTWAEKWIEEVLELGVLEPSPDGNFYPAEPLTRAGYAKAVARILVAATRDPDLETRYFGEDPSRFGDVSSSHYAYAAMALCTERGIMKADLVTGRFEPAGTVTGADALLIIRSVQNSLRMTF